MVGVDARRNLRHAGNDFSAKYATDVFTQEAVNVIRKHDPKEPLYLEVSHVAVHAVQGNYLQVRNETENDQKYGYIGDKNRRLFAGKHISWSLLRPVAPAEFKMGVAKLPKKG